MHFDTRVKLAIYQQFAEKGMAPKPGEMRDVFAAIDLVGDFWDPKADSFGSRSDRPSTLDAHGADLEAAFIKPIFSFGL